MKGFFSNVRIVVLLCVLFLALVAINPRPWNNGVAIRAVAKESAALEAGIPPPTAKIQPVARERILAVNNIPIESESDYYNAIGNITALGPNTTFTLRTNKDFYTLKTQPAYETITLNETETVNVTNEVFNETLNETLNVTTTETRNKTKQRYLGVEDVGLSIYSAPKSNIRQGLELSGGTRVILQPEEAVSATDLDLIISNIKERLNVYGLSDLVVRPATDLSGNDFIIVEIAGANKDEVRQLLSEQGKFEARIGNDTVFRGGNNDITYVCRSADCSGIDPRVGCGQTSDGWNCRFRFSISLSPQAAQQQASITKNLEVKIDTGGSYLEKPLDLYLDDSLVDTLQIGSDLKGRSITDIQISGSGTGVNQQEAITDALANMKKLQTVLITGSLPVKLQIVKTDAVSPVLGQEFVKNAILVGFLSILAVVTIVFIRYRDMRVAIPMSLTMLSEAVIILGFASLVGWNLDLAAIAAIIISIGTGVDDQIVIADETLRGEGDKENHFTWKEKIKRALFIIMASYITTVAAMVPLWFAGAGLLRGFAVTTIVGVSIGVFITRPAFAAIVEYLFKEE